MPSSDIIRSYLIELGWKIDELSARKYDDALKRSDTATKKFAFGAASDTRAASIAGAAGGAVGAFAAVGATFVAATAAIAGATVGLLGSVAKQDLSYQMLARRMFMGVDATRKMKLATDALGVTLEEIIWGPPELAERYHQLIIDETHMLKALGGDQGESAFRRIRDIQFQFTRMEPAIKVFGMALTEDIVNKLFGGPEALEIKLKHFVDWFEKAIPDIADKLSSKLAPVLQALGTLADKLFTQKNVDWVVHVITSGADTVSKDMQFLQSPDKWGMLWDRNKSVSQNLNDLMHGGQGFNTAEMQGKAAAAAKKYTSDPGAIAEFLALIQQESNFDPLAQPRRTGAFGLGQVMPKNWPKGRDSSDPDTQLDVAAAMFFGALKRRGSARGALNDYYGHGTPGLGEPTFDQYFQQWQDKYNHWKSDPLSSGTYQPMAYHQSVNVGGIHITTPGASGDEIEKRVYSAIDRANRENTRRMIARTQGAYV